MIITPTTNSNWEGDAYISQCVVFVARQDRKNIFCIRTYLFLVSDYIALVTFRLMGIGFVYALLFHKACQCAVFFFLLSTSANVSLGRKSDTSI